MTQPAPAFASGHACASVCSRGSRLPGGIAARRGAGLFTSTLQIGIVRPPSQVCSSVLAVSLIPSFSLVSLTFPAKTQGVPSE
jgi:hypothetical protein